MKKLFTLLLMVAGLTVFSQTKVDSLGFRVNKVENALRILREFRIMAYVQAQYQQAESNGASSYEGGDFPTAASNRFIIRRGRLIVSYEHDGAKGFRIFQAVVHLDMSEKGVTAKDVFGRIIDPWTGWFGLQVGLMFRPFGFEVPFPDDIRESPERGRMSQILMPNERDLGAQLLIETPRTSPLLRLKNPLYLRLDAGLFNGTGSAADAFANRKDFIGRAQFRDTIHTSSPLNFILSGGTSLYYGTVLQTTGKVYELRDNASGELVYTNVSDSAHINKKYFLREYYGADLQLAFDYPLATTILRGEFIMGQEPGGVTSGIPTSVAPTTPGSDLYIRKFNGAYFYFVQTFKQKAKGQTIYHDFIVKYDWYNPNTQIAQKNLSSSVDHLVSGADVAYQTLGIGYIFRPYEFFQIEAYYDFVRNSNTGITGFTGNLKDNILTIRTQFRFDTNWFGRKVKEF